MWIQAEKPLCIPALVFDRLTGAARATKALLYRESKILSIAQAALLDFKEV